ERLSRLLAPQKPLAVQIAAIKTLAALESTVTTTKLFESFSGLTPDAQAVLLEEVVAREALVRELLRRVAAGIIPRAAIDATLRVTLANHPLSDVQSEAAQLFANASDAEKLARLKSFEGLDVAAGDALAGREAFIKHCAVCHRWGDLGHVVGPDLAALTDK